MLGAHAKRRDARLMMSGGGPGYAIDTNDRTAVWAVARWRLAINGSRHPNTAEILEKIIPSSAPDRTYRRLARRSGRGGSSPGHLIFTKPSAHLGESCGSANGLFSDVR